MSEIKVVNIIGGCGSSAVAPPTSREMPFLGLSRACRLSRIAFLSALFERFHRARPSRFGKTMRSPRFPYVVTMLNRGKERKRTSLRLVRFPLAGAAAPAPRTPRRDYRMPSACGFPPGPGALPFSGRRG